MFSRSILVAFVASGLVAAAPQGTTTTPSPTCNSGALQCCESVQPASSLGSSGDSGLLDLIPITLQGLNIPIGITCTPIDVIGVGGDSCQQQTVCCENNTFSGVVALGCTPIGVGL
ncbi:unnamed protein product [Peniophora sp. CBMAI 1063]|nr:unnamed protein product [Peniophora sp. CBMAI 1063]